MSNKKELMKRLNERKNSMIEFLDEYNKLYVGIANKIMKDRYADLGLYISQTKSDDDSNKLSGCYNYLTLVEKTQRLQNLLHKKDVIKGRENDFRIRYGGYNQLAYSLSLLYNFDIDIAVGKAKGLPEIIKKFDTYGFTPAEVAALSHLLFFERVKVVPKAYIGQHPSYNSLLVSFIHFLNFNDFLQQKDDEKRAHQGFGGYGHLSNVDVDLEELYSESE